MNNPADSASMPDGALPQSLSEEVVAALLPRPREVRVSSGGMQIGEGDALLILVGEDVPAHAERGAKRLADLLHEEFGIPARVVPCDECGPLQMLLIAEERRTDDLPTASSPILRHSGASHGPDGYTLSVDARGAAVSGASAEGLYWGAMTLRQLFARHEGSVVAPAVRIADWPRYAWRGFMFDSGRAPNSPAKMRRIIRICSAFKMNCLILREGDDELNAVRYRTNSLGSRNPYALAMEEVEDLIAYAADHGVALIPEIESLGHSMAKGQQYPGLVEGGIETTYEGIGVHRRKVHLKPNDGRVLALLESIYEEWMAILPSPYLHLGLDEVLMDREPQAEHLARVLDLVDRVAARHGREVRPIVWADAPPTPADRAERVVRCLWSYSEHRDRGPVGIYNEHLQRQGIEPLSHPRATQPVLMAGGSGAGHTPYSKSDYEGAFENLAEWARWGENLGNYMGLVAVQWSGNMTDDWLPDFLAAADYAWQPPDEVPPFEPEMVRVRAQLRRLKDAASPDADEMDPPAWDGIWLDGHRWHKEIITQDEE